MGSWGDSVKALLAPLSPGATDGSSSWLPVAAIAGGAVAAAYLLLSTGRPNDAPGPVFMLPFVGETADFFADPATFMWKRYKKYKSKVFRTSLFGTKFYVCGEVEELRGALGDPELVEGSLPVSTVNKLIDLYNRNGERHKVFRRHQANSLSPASVRASIPSFLEVITRHTDAWLAESQSAGGLLNIDAAIKAMIMELGVSPIAGLRMSRQEMDELREMAITVQAGLFAPPIYFPGTIWYKSITTRPAYLRLLQSYALRRFPPKGYEPGAAAGDPGQLKLLLENDVGGYPGVDTTKAVLLEFQEMGEVPTAAQIAERLVQNLLGATETSVGLCLSLMLVLAVSPHIQEGIRREQAALLKAHGPAITHEQLATGMPLTDAAVREAARLVPPVHGFFRHVKKDITLGGYHVPAGSQVLLSGDFLHGIEMTDNCDDLHRPRPLHMDHRQLQLAYKPERWLVGASEKPRYLHAFSYGPHSCLGKDLAIMELKILLASLARKCRFELASPSNLQFRFLPYTHVVGGPAKLRLILDPL